MVATRARSATRRIEGERRTTREIHRFHLGAVPPNDRVAIRAHQQPAGRGLHPFQPCGRRTRPALGPDHLDVTTTRTRQELWLSLNVRLRPSAMERFSARYTSQCPTVRRTAQLPIRALGCRQPAVMDARAQCTDQPALCWSGCCVSRHRHHAPHARRMKASGCRETAAELPAPVRRSSPSGSRPCRTVAVVARRVDAPWAARGGVDEVGRHVVRDRARCLACDRQGAGTGDTKHNRGWVPISTN